MSKVQSSLSHHPSQVISCDNQTQQHASLLTVDHGYAEGTTARPRTILLSSGDEFHDSGRKVNAMNLMRSKVFLSMTGILIVTAIANMTIAMWVIRILQLGNVGIV